MKKNLLLMIILLLIIILLGILISSCTTQTSTQQKGPISLEPTLPTLNLSCTKDILAEYPLSEDTLAEIGEFRLNIPTYEKTITYEQIQELFRQQAKRFLSLTG